MVIGVKMIIELKEYGVFFSLMIFGKYGFGYWYFVGMSNLIVLVEKLFCFLFVWNIVCVNDLKVDVVFDVI